MRRIVIAASVLLTIIFTLIFFYFKDAFTKDDDEKLFTYIPQTASLIVEFNNDESLYDLYKGSSIIPTLIYDEFIDDIKGLQNLFIDNASLGPKLKNKKIIASVHQVKADKLDVLLVTSFQASYLRKPEELFKENLSAKNTLTRRQFDGQDIYEITFAGIGKKICFCVKNNVLLVSYTPMLVENAIRQSTNKNTLGTDVLFEKTRTMSSRGTIMDVYLNYKKLPEFFQTFLLDEQRDKMKTLTEFCSYSLLNVNYKSDAWMLSGQSIADNGDMASVFLNQSPQKQTLPSFFSNRTMFFYAYGISNYGVFLNDLKKQEQLKGDGTRQREVDRVNRIYRIFIEDELTNLVGNEFAISYSEGADNSSSNEEIVFLKLKNAEKAVQLFNSIKEIERKTASVPSAQVYKDNTINPFLIKNFMNIVAGDLFKNFRANYYIIMEDRLVLASDLNALQHYIDDFLLLQTLFQNNFYKTFNESVGDKSNFYFYANTDRSNSFLAKQLNKRSYNEFSNVAGANNYSAFAFQLSSNNKSLFTNVYFPLKKEDMEEMGLLWKVRLDGDVATKPFIVQNHNTFEQEIIVQDDLDKLYLVSANGKIIWKTQLTGKIISEIYQVDYYKNGKLQFLFNTQNQLYLIDRNGMMMPNYPIRLSTNATCGLALFDYEDTRDYRVFVSCDNRSLFGYDISGRPLQGWNPKLGIGILQHPMQHVNVQGRDYLFVNNNEGDFYFFKRNGDLISKYDDKERTSYRNPFVFDAQREFAKNRFINTDVNGKIKSVFLDGRRLYKHIGNWSESHFFTYANISGDSAKEYLYLDKNQLFVYKDDSSIVYNYEFQSDSTSPIQLFLSDSSRYTVGVTSYGTGQIFLFNEDGTLKKGFPMEGRTLFSIGKEKNVLVVGGKEHYLYAYKIQP